MPADRPVSPKGVELAAITTKPVNISNVTIGVTGPAGNVMKHGGVQETDAALVASTDQIGFLERHPGLR